MMRQSSRLLVVGLGGAGWHTLDRLISEYKIAAELVCMHTDAQALAMSKAPHRLQLGVRLARGLGSSGNASMGAAAAEESRGELQQLMAMKDIVLVLAGMGGGTGTGAAPIVAAEAAMAGAIVIGMVTQPFTFEGRRRAQAARTGTARLLPECNLLLSLENDHLLRAIESKASMHEAFKIFDRYAYLMIEAIQKVSRTKTSREEFLQDLKRALGAASPSQLSAALDGGGDVALSQKSW